jgi:hypothetical protein
MGTKIVFPYYSDLGATLRCGDKPWPEWPHVYLANIEGPADFRSFTKKFGRELFENRVFKWPMPKRAATAGDVPAEPSDDVPAGPAGGWVPTKRTPTETRYFLAENELFQARDLLRNAWDGEAFALEVIAGKSRDINLLPAVNAPFKTSLVIAESGGIEIFVEDLWTYARIAFLRDYALGKTQRCNNPECNRSPYFLQNKKGQQFCEHACAVLASVQRFRKNKENKPKHKVRQRKKKNRGTKG